ncbi:hypothetical protein [Dysosmobacter sp.]|uniref:hypothetical protein n=1 Tax=Dysosmobacter sp. TaxID=2591382 RepID=UPI002A869197|nr:hypothetical protein [Dysosmobacter sp.]MDY3985150.1 hypothetical protein [Dysosmobacter sp.]
MSNERKNTIIWFMIVIGLLLCVLGGRLGGGASGYSLLQKGGAILVIIGGVLEFTLFRCPHCGRSLGRKRITRDTCPYCGEKLD